MLTFITEEVIRHLTLWQNGFQVEDGELMSYDDPAHADVLEAFDAGYLRLDLCIYIITLRFFLFSFFFFFAVMLRLPLWALIRAQM